MNAGDYSRCSDKNRFQWAECQIDALERCLRSEDHLESVLCSLSRTLDETYERMLPRISLESKDEARRMLTMLCCTRRPLTAEELLEGMAVELGESPRLNPKRKLMDIYAINEICPGFIEFDLDHDTEEVIVRFAHFSVQEYLESERICAGMDVAVFRVTKELANAEMVCICLTILLEPDLLKVEDIVGNSPIRTPSPRLAIANYAARYWPAHYQDCQENTLVINQASRLFSNRNQHFKAWIALHNVDGLASIAAPLYYASLLGLDAVVRNILASYPNRTGGMKSCHKFLMSGRYNSLDIQKREEDCLDLNDEGGYYKTALLAASVGGHVNIVQQLLAKGVEIHVNDDLHGSALHAASHNGHISTLMYLLDRRTVEGLQHKSKFTSSSFSVIWLPTTIALAFAAWFAHSKESRLSLLVYAAAALLLARSFGYSLSFRGQFIKRIGVKHALSLGESANVDSNDRYPWTPLSRAAENGHIEVAAFLLERGANVIARDSYDKRFNLPP